MAQKGVFIVLEGADGSGKTTQFRLLGERLKAVGYDVEVFDFPRYDQASSHFIRHYLNGAFGPADRVSPYTASLFYALDRYEAAPAIRRALEAGKIVLSDRYVGANMAHQGAKLKDQIEQRSFFVWEDGLEFQLLGIPRPSLNLVLSMPAEMSQEMVKKRVAEKGGQLDEHEKDLEHLRRSVDTYNLLCDLFPRDFQKIEVVEKAKMLSITEVNNRLWQIIKPLLPAAPNKARSVVLQLGELLESPEPKKKPQLEASTVTPPANTTSQRSVELKGISLFAAYALIFSGEISCEITNILWTKNPDAYYLPELSGKIAALYKESFNKLGNYAKELESKLESDKSLSGDDDEAMRAILPLGALCNATLAGEKTAFDSLALRLATAPQKELQNLARTLRSDTSRAAESPLGKDQISDAGKSVEAITKLIKEHLPGHIAPQTERVALLEAWPRNEFDLLVDGIYPHSDLPLSAIGHSLDKWKYDTKKDALLAAVSHGGSTLLRQIFYKWDLVVAQTELDQLLKILPARSLQVQPQTPRYGYEMPEVIEENALDDAFQGCFDESLKLFSSLQAADQETLAPYATLLGHKIRCELMVDAECLAKALKSNRLSSSDILAEMAEKIGEVHPLITSAIEQKVTNLVAENKRPRQNPKTEAKPSLPKKNHRRRSGSRRKRK